MIFLVCYCKLDLLSCTMVIDHCLSYKLFDLIHSICTCTCFQISYNVCCFKISKSNKSPRFHIYTLTMSTLRYISYIFVATCPLFTIFALCLLVARLVYSVVRIKVVRQLLAIIQCLCIKWSVCIIKCHRSHQRFKIYSFCFFSVLEVYLI